MQIYDYTAWLPDGSDLVAEEMWFGLGWNSPFPTKAREEELLSLILFIWIKNCA